MVDLVSTVPITLIIIVLIVCIPAIVKMVTWIINLVKKHKQNQSDSFEAGRQAALEEIREDERFRAGEKRIGELETKEKMLEQIQQSQKLMLDSLIESSQLDIKYAIKRVYDKIKSGRTQIDAMDLDLLEARFKIYKARGGNSWAEDLMNYIRTHAAVTTIDFMQVDPKDQGHRDDN